MSSCSSNINVRTIAHHHLTGDIVGYYGSLSSAFFTFLDQVDLNQNGTDISLTTTVSSNSANWNQAFVFSNIFASNSALYDSVYSTVYTMSALWNIDLDNSEVNIVVQNNSACWISACSLITFVQSNSSNWTYQGNDIKSLTASFVTLNHLYNGFLPLSGGTITGNLTAISSTFFHKNIAINNVSFGTGRISNNIAIGNFALSSNNNGQRNIALGKNTLAGLFTGDDNIAIGENAMAGHQSGASNIVIGADSLQFPLFNHTSNIVLGRASLNNAGTAANNIILGSSSLINPTVANNNIAIGVNVFGDLQSGSGIIAIGGAIAPGQSGSQDSIYLGTEAIGEDSDVNAVVIGGYNPKGRGPNTTVLGTNATLSTFIFGVLSAGSGGTSIQWNNTYNTVRNNSSLWLAPNLTLIQANSANWQSNYSNTNSNSANWNYQGNDIKSLTANYSSVYSNVNTNSAIWNIDNDDANVNTFVYNNSANIINVNTVVQTNSAEWGISGRMQLFMAWA